MQQQKKSSNQPVETTTAFVDDRQSKRKKRKKNNTQDARECVTDTVSVVSVLCARPFRTHDWLLRILGVPASVSGQRRHAAGKLELQVTKRNNGQDDDDGGAGGGCCCKQPRSRGISVSSPCSGSRRESPCTVRRQ